jgi:hypothetical protein
VRASNLQALRSTGSTMPFQNLHSPLLVITLFITAWVNHEVRKVMKNILEVKTLVIQTKLII